MRLIHLGEMIMTKLLRNLLCIVGLMALVGQASANQRDLNSREGAEVLKAIRQVAQTLPGLATAGDLENALVDRRIKTDDKWPDYLLGQTPITMFGKRTITINSNIIPDAKAAIYQKRYGQIYLFEDRTKLEAVLTHEWLHTTQDFMRAKFDRKGIERDAYGLQKRYYQAVLAKLPQDADYKMKKLRIEGLIDLVDSQIESGDFLYSDEIVDDGAHFFDPIIVP